MKKLKTTRQNNPNGSLIEVEKDGNCFFRCVAYEILGDSSKHREVRNTTVEYIENNELYFSNLIDGSFRDHVRNMLLVNGETCSWATEAEVTAAAMCYGIDIYVNVICGLQNNWLKFPMQEGDSSRSSYLCLRHMSDHFDVLRMPHKPELDVHNPNDLIHSPKPFTDKLKRTSPEAYENIPNSGITDIGKQEAVC
ncbi:OTU domain-containing protein 4-like [Ruditapes philippinarum]|uniref:OTU domain-containing protein 4-like n=1 Tax=Ruditapes philippinarum TaxID=129788 RepID=UPI00295AA1F4|nr:OTU domain-containing protein 4-like [Ruditapes philippinarum]